MQKGDFVVGFNEPSTVHPVHRAKSGHSEGVEFGSAQGANTRGSNDGDTGVDARKDLLMPQRGVLIEESINEHNRVTGVRRQPDEITVGRRRMNTGTRHQDADLVRRQSGTGENVNLGGHGMNTRMPGQMTFTTGTSRSGRVRSTTIVG
jgi:hypothetical protein